MGDPGLAQGEHGAEEGVQRWSLASPRQLAQAGYRRRPDDECGIVARTTEAGHQHVRRRHPGALGQQGHVGLVLDLLDPRERQGGSRVPVEDEAAGLGEQLGVGGVTAVEGDRHGSPPRSVPL